MPRRSIIVAVVIAAALSISAAHAKGGGGTAAHAGGGGGCQEVNGAADQRSTTVVLSSNCFSATVTRVDEGATVTFLNKDPQPHTVTGTGFAWGDSENLLEGDQVAYAFPDSGTYVYACLLHLGMSGAIVVGDGKGTEPASVRAVSSAGSAKDQPGAGSAGRSGAQDAASSSDGAGWTMLAVIGAASAALVLCGATFVTLRVRRLNGRAAA